MQYILKKFKYKIKGRKDEHKRLLGLMAISGFAFVGLSGVRAATNIEASAVCPSTGNVVAFTRGTNGEDVCHTTLSAAFTAAGKGETVYLLNDVTNSTALNITKNVVLDLNGHTFTASSVGIITITGVNVTIKNGTLKAASSTDSIIKMVNTTNDGITLNISGDVEVDGTNLAKAVIDVDSNANKITKKTIVNINGTWKNIAREVINCPSTAISGTTKDVLTINLNANIEGASTTNALVGIDAGHSTVNVLGGTYTNTTGSVFNLSNGVLNIKDGSLVSKADTKHVINVTAATAELNVSGGNVTAEGDNAYTISFANNSAKGTYSITGGTFTSGKDINSKQLPAFIIADNNFIKENEDIITGGTFVGGVVARTSVGTGSSYDGPIATSKLVKGDYSTDENGNVVVGGEKPPVDEPSEKPGETTDPGKGDNEIDHNANTGDNIMSYVTLAVSSLGALGVAVKKVVR